MKFLFDTNAIIPAEPTSQTELEDATASVAELLGLITRAEFQVYIHPVSVIEIEGDSNQERRTLRLKLLHKYQRLPAPPAISNEFISAIGRPAAGSHSEKDAVILSALLRNAADFLVTDDNGIHRWATRLGVESRVLTISDALATVRGLLPKQIEPPPAVEFAYCHELDIRDPIFDSLRGD